MCWCVLWFRSVGCVVGIQVMMNSKKIMKGEKLIVLDDLNLLKLARAVKPKAKAEK
jgi:hypothetical protein